MSNDWVNKLYSIVPKWFINSGKHTNSVVYGMAAMLDALQNDVKETVDQTFISKAVGEYLDWHGSERGVERIEGESDKAYRARIISFADSSNLAAIKRIIDSVLLEGSSLVYDTTDARLGLYCDRKNYLGSNSLLRYGPTVNCFTVIIPEQRPKVSSFFGSSFFNEPSYFSHASNVKDILDGLINLVNESKAVGVTWEMRIK